jgi:hypothetical protein
MRTGNRAIRACWIGIVAATAWPASALEIALPAETAVYRPSPLPGYPLVQQHCVACHSADYVAYQPPESTRAYWEQTVAKMKNAFGWPIPDSDVPPLVDYLVKTYGAERTAASPAVSAAHQDGQARTPAR